MQNPASSKVFNLLHSIWQCGWPTYICIVKGNVDLLGVCWHLKLVDRVLLTSLILYFSVSQGKAVVLQRKTEDGEYIEVGKLGPSDYFGRSWYSGNVDTIETTWHSMVTLA